MNAPASSEIPPSAPPEWAMKMGFEQTTDGTLYLAEVKRGGQAMCRIALAGRVSDEAAAHKALAVKARTWIDEFSHREGKSSSAEDQPLVLREN
ncbi:hypothetical protein [Variovorax guangxiensis]|uniref:hypothetical protein n=1 Tax=Variovorax guangxiensis TaxID=1775474 RepID=UPI0028569B6D|nr:hypothetical protein [Variovorax guangxiensis]MDR6861380.1 hypothetical protein [Variovorax guangxiensis]